MNSLLEAAEEVARLEGVLVFLEAGGALVVPGVVHREVARRTEVSGSCPNHLFRRLDSVAHLEGGIFGRHLGPVEGQYGLS